MHSQANITFKQKNIKNIEISKHSVYHHWLENLKIGPYLFDPPSILPPLHLAHPHHLSSHQLLTIFFLPKIEFFFTKTD